MCLLPHLKLDVGILGDSLKKKEPQVASEYACPLRHVFPKYQKSTPCPQGRSHARRMAQNLTASLCIVFLKETNEPMDVSTVASILTELMGQRGKHIIEGIYTYVFINN